jgi:site-specific DNA-methyltransferase (adenine-specific)
MKNRNLDHSNNWATPKDFYDKLNNEFNFDFDPCPLNKEKITDDKNGLLIEWGNSNFINPPYSRKLKQAFVLKAIDEAKKGKTCVLLIPVSTSTKLFHEHIQPNAKEIRFIKGRLKFSTFDEEGNLYTPKQSGMHDSMVIVLKINLKVK